MQFNRKGKDSDQCAYCTNPASTKDHIPPQTIYAKGTQDRPNVPACVDCNRGSSLDDEYMQRLSLLWGADSSKAAVEVEQKLFRALSRKEARGLQRDMANSLFPLSEVEELSFPGGIKIQLEGDRIARIVDKLVKGWWFKLTDGDKIPDAHVIMKYLVGSRRVKNEIYTINEQEVRKIVCFESEDEAFSLCMAYCPSSLLTCWMFRFFKVFEIMAYTAEDFDDTFRIIDLRQQYHRLEDR